MKTLLQGEAIYVRMGEAITADSLQYIINSGEVGFQHVVPDRGEVSTTADTLCCACSAGAERKHVKHIELINLDTASHTVTLFIRDAGGVDFTIFKGTLHSHYTFHYVDGRMFILDSNGAETGRIGDKSFTHIQGIPSDTWLVVHGLEKFPSVTITDSSGNAILAPYEHLDINTTQITFRTAGLPSPQSGFAYFN